MTSDFRLSLPKTLYCGINSTSCSVRRSVDWICVGSTAPSHSFERGTDALFARQGRILHTTDLAVPTNRIAASYPSREVVDHSRAYDAGAASETVPGFQLIVNFQALLSRLSKICLSRMESALSTPRFSCAYVEFIATSVEPHEFGNVVLFVPASAAKEQRSGGRNLRRSCTMS